MDYICGPLLLYSQDKVRMMDFFSDVLEFEVDSISDSVCRDSLNLKMLERESQVDDYSHSSIIFSFKVQSERQLDEIMSKYNFFLYRKPISSRLTEKLDLIQMDKRKILTISDIDQRLWRFECEINLSTDLQ